MNKILMEIAEIALAVLNVIIIFFLISLFIYAFGFLRILFKRIKFLSKIHKLCKQNDIELTVFSKFRSLFHRGDTPDFSFKKDGKTYDIYIFSALPKNARYHFTPDGNAEIYRKERGFIPFHIGFFHRGIAEKSITQIYEGRVTKHQNFTFPDNENEKILLVHPIPLQVTNIKGNGAKPVYNGELIYKDIKFYTGHGLRKLLSERE